MDPQHWYKRSTTVEQVLEYISSQKLKGKCNKVHFITDCIDKDIIRTNIQENRCILNQIRKIQDIGNKLNIHPTKPSTPYHIGYIVKRPLRSEWYGSMFQTTKNGNIHNILCTIFTFLIDTRQKDTQTQNMYYIRNNWHLQPTWFILKNMCRWIIHVWRSWIHCIIWNCGWYPLPSNYHINCICRRPHYIYIGNLQWL